MSPYSIAMAAAVTSTVSAHLSMRRGARATSRPARIVFTLGALGLFGCTTLFGLYALGGMPLKATTVWAAASYPAVAVLSRLLFDERSSFLAWFGVGLVVCGIVLFGLS